MVFGKSAGFLMDEAQAMKVFQLSSEMPASPFLVDAALAKKSLDDDEEAFLMGNLCVDAARAK